MHQADWYLGETNINLVMIYIGRDGEVTLNINYQNRVSEASRNL